LESFPYALVAVFAASAMIAGYLIKKSNWSYHKPLGRWALALVAAVAVFGGALAYTRMSEMIENEAFGPRPFGAVSAILPARIG